ncbi:MAG: ABC transporter ATP-binding protein [Clostridiales bacterium]|jgi:peptide/nickel transport system ATP-binding protein|nr:ABC transporter ATP-binding protein [Clostridiales bacterium]
MADELLRIENLSVEYHVGVKVSNAVNKLDITINQGEALGLVGETGAGKTTTALSIMNLLPKRISFITSGNVYYRGKSMMEMSEEQQNAIRGEKISMVFANPLSSLNPLFTVGHQIALAYETHYKVSKAASRKRAAELLKLVGIADYRIDDYPHQLSGGMRQRVGIAAALACNPELLICDEPTTALDVTIQAQILELMKNLQKEFNSSLLMITHNLGIVAEMCQNVAIMYGGATVEHGSVREIFTHPMHHYTKGLLNAIPKLEGQTAALESIPGLVANALDLPGGCRFHPRCAYCTEECKNELPHLMTISDEHYVRCWNVEGIK